MDRDPWPSTYDPDLDEVPRRAPIATPEPMVSSRRLVVNPFLAVTGFVGGVVLLRASLQWHNLVMFFAGLGLFCAIPYLIQSHCLDCGKTIWLMSSRRHACPPARARSRAGRTGRWTFPSQAAQVSLWLHLLVPVAVLMLILFVISR